MSAMKHYPFLLVLHVFFFLVAPAAAIAQMSRLVYEEEPQFVHETSFSYIYRIPADSVANVVYKNQLPDVRAAWLQQAVCRVAHNRVDSLLQSDYLSPGHYVALRLVRNVLHFNFHRKTAIEPNIIDLGAVHVLELKDKENQDVRDATVIIRGKTIQYDYKMRGYVLREFKDGDTIWVRRWEDIFFYTGNVHRRYGVDDYGNRNYPDYSRYRGYMVTNKPKYLPGDTVKFKAYLLDPNTGKPVTEKMKVNLEGIGYDNRNTFNINAEMEAQAPGVYFSEFVLGDSVKMDKEYNLKLQGHKTQKWMVQTFKTEDYLLDEAFLSVRGENYRQYQKGDSIHLYAYAHNSNNLPLTDGTMTVTLLPYGTQLRGKMADTLYHNTVPVNPVGETYIGCGTSMFPDSLSISVLCRVRLAAANGETRDTSFQLAYTCKPYYINVQQSGRTLTAQLIRNKKSVKGEGIYLNPFDGTLKTLVSYPAYISIDEHTHWVSFSTDVKDSLSESYGYHVAGDSLKMFEYYIGDTAYLQIINPQQAYVRYSVYKGKEYHSHGSVSGDATLKFAAGDGETFTVMAKYKWLEQRNRTVTIAKYYKKIQIDVKKKDVVFPGQADSISIDLKTVDGVPVAKTNLTVFAFNSQFKENYVPTLPYSGILRSGLRYVNPVRSFQSHDFVRTRTIQLADRRWLAKCGADTMLFFRYCLMPKNGLTQLAYGKPESSLPQMGVFLSTGWQFEKPVIIYVDDRPVYYNRAVSTDHEAFYVSSGRHSIRIRTTDALYTIPSVSISNRTKSNFYINLDSPASEVIVKEMPDTLTAEECAQLAAWFIYYMPDPDGYDQQYPIVFTQYPVQYRLQAGQRGVYMIGPFNPRDSIHFFHALNTKKKFMPEKDFQYTFKEGMMRMETMSICDQAGQRHYSSKYWPAGERGAGEPVLQDTSDLYPPQRYVHVQYEATSDRIKSGLRGIVKNDRDWPMVRTRIYLRNVQQEMPVIHSARDGSFRLDVVPPGVYTMDVDCPGYITLRLNNVKVKKGKITILNITLETNLKKSMQRPVKELSEVTVVAYKVPLIDKYAPGTTSSVTSETIDKMPTRSTNAMSGTTADVYHGNENALNIQGGRDERTTYNIDGVQVRGSQGINLAQGMIVASAAYNSAKAAETMPPNYNFLNSAQGQEFVDDFMTNMTQASGLRKNFSDYAIWEPNLWTDKNGHVSFRAIYPDNMTSWKTYVLAMNEKGFSGQTMKITRSFKPLSAELSLPRFMLYGDTAEAVGRISNYTSTAFSLRTSFMRQGVEVKTKDMSLSKAALELQRIEAPAVNRLDTIVLPVSFSIATGNGYTDGEERVIPVFPVGVAEDKGFFSALFGDTMIYSRPESGMFFTGNTTISVDGSLVDVMLNEIENLKVYPHGCTEQLTTKLLAIHYEEEIKRLMQDSKLNNAEAKREILEKLVEAQNADGSFGWWRGNSNDYRITNYVLSTMYKANTDGWLSVILNRGFSFLRNNLDQMSDRDLITALSTLSAGRYPVNYSPYIARLDTTVHSLYDRFCLVRIKQENDIAYAADLDSLVKLARRTGTGTHWSAHNGYDWYRNDLATTLVAYKVIKNDSTYRYMTNDILHYVIGKRGHGYYSNTAESGLVLTHVLPDLLQKAGSKDKIRQQTRLLIKGSVQDTVTEFPKRYQLKNRKDQDFSFTKTGISPVYVSVMYRYFNPHPEAREDSFEVQTYFIKNGDTVTSLKQGDDVILRAVVTCKGPAEYVMIEVPVPAGCVQQDSRRGYMEAHRENYKERTLVFCNTLVPGTYTFDVPLEARYKGSYNINPAKAGMMYYAGEYGNTTVKRIVIE